MHSEDPFDIPNFLRRPSWSEPDSGLKWDLPHEAAQPTAQAVPLEQQGETENKGAEHGLQRRLGDECDAQRALLRRPPRMSGLNSFEPRPKLAVISEPPANSRSRVVSKSRHVKYWLFAVFTTAAIAAPMGADTTLPGGEDRNLAIVAAPRQPLPEAEATNAPAAPSDDENQLSQTNWSERASQLKVVLPTVVASSEPSPTPGLLAPPRHCQGRQGMPIPLWSLQKMPLLRHPLKRAPTITRFKASARKRSCLGWRRRSAARLASSAAK